MSGINLPNEPLPALALYNPALLKKEDLIAQFVARRPLLDRLVEDLRRSGKGGYQHHLIIGPRGSGKTTLLRRLRYAIEDDAELSARWLPLVFPEEQYNVSRLSDLWVNCLDALSDMLERRNREAEAEALDDQIEKLPADDEKRRSQAALDLLIGWAKKEKRALVLLFDNSDLIFDRLKNDHWAIREVLSADNNLLFIGATSAPIEATYKNEGAFYDFFKTHEVRGLTDQETRDVIFTLARLRNTPDVIELLEREPGRIRTLNLLTGGNLRTIVVLYQVLARGSDDSIRADIEQLLDQYTPLYKHRFEVLSQQEQQVVDALALNWDPATAAVLAEKLRMETNVVSASLNRLANDGVVEKVASPPSEKLFFQIAERFFNIWYLMRASRRVRRKLIWLVEFLKIFYGSAGLRLRAHRLIHEPLPPERDQYHRAELALAYARAIEEPGLRRALENEGIISLMNCKVEDRQSIRAMFDFDGEDASLKLTVERFQSLRELSERIERTKGKLPADIWNRLIASPSLSIEEKKKRADEISNLGLDECKPLIEQFTAEANQLTERFGDEVCQELFDAVRNGQMADGADVEGADAVSIKFKDVALKVIARLTKYDQTKDIALLDEAEKILPEVKSPYIWLSWIERAASSESDTDKLIHVYRQIMALEGHDSRTWFRIGKLLKYYFKRYDESEAAYRKSIELDPNVARVWAGLGHLFLEYVGRFDEAEAAFRRAIELDPNFDTPWRDLGILFADHLNRFDDAEAAFRRAIELEPNNTSHLGRLINLMHFHLKNYEDAEKICQKFIAIDPSNAKAWGYLGHLLHYHLKKFEEAEAAYRKAVELDSNDPSLWSAFGDLLQYHFKRYKESESAYRKALEIDQSFTESWFELGNLLHILERYEEAETAYRRAIEINPNDPRLWSALGELLQHHLKKYEESEAVYRKAIELNSKDAQSWFELGNLFQYHLKKYEEADSAYRRAIELEPNAPWAWNNLGTLLQYGLKKYEEAELAYQKVIEIAPKETRPLRNLGSLFHYTMKQRFNEAETAYRKAIEIDPNDANTHHALGNLLGYRLNRPEEAEIAFQKAVELGEGNAQFQNSLAWQRFLLNKALDEAEQHSRRSVELEPDNLVFAHTLACILARLGKWEEASVYARKFIVESDDEYLESYWDDIVVFFRDAVATNHAKEAVALLDETEYGERWRPLREGLQAIAEDDSSYLLRVAPEVRQPAEEIVALLLPEGVKLGASPKPARARQTRRRRSLS